MKVFERHVAADEENCDGDGRIHRSAVLRKMTGRDEAIMTDKMNRTNAARMMSWPANSTPQPPETAMKLRLPLLAAALATCLALAVSAVAVVRAC